MRDFPIVTKENANCLDCYRCLRKCAMDAIDFSTGRARIIQNKCVLCGECVTECPQRTKQIITDMPRVVEALAAGKRLVLSLGGMMVTYFECSEPEAVIQKAYQIGFEKAEASDTLEPHALRAIAETIRGSEQKLWISSHCPTVVNLIEQHYAHLLPNLLPFPSLAKMHAEALRAENPGCEVVYVTACPGEFYNRETLAAVDYIITFQDLSQLLRYTPQVRTEVPDGPPAPYRGGYAFTVVGNMATELLKAGVLRPGHTEWFSGLKSCLNILDGLDPNNLPDVQFLELMSCQSGCVSGLHMRHKGSIMDRCLCLERYYHARETWPIRPYTGPVGQVAYLDRTYYPPKADPSDVAEEMQRFFDQEGAKILNCGACGYDSCYEKSAAVVRGEADRQMCLSYMKAKAESFANAIVNSSDSGILVFDESLKILQTNPRLLKIFNSYQLKEGDLLSDHMATDAFRRVIETGKVLRDQLHHYEDIHLWTRETIQPMEGAPGHYLALFANVTGQVAQRQELEAVKGQLLEKADEVINDQMRVAQEIASLLGETTSQTKITLLKLVREFEREKELS